MDRVADWCRVMLGGACRWDNSIDGLREALMIEFDMEVQELDGDWDGICEAVQDNDEPVIVTIANPNPLAELVGNHAVVIFQIMSPSGRDERVVYMDPESGTHESKPTEEFLQWWDTPGQRGFSLCP